MRVEASAPANDHIGYGESDWELNGEYDVINKFIRDGQIIFDVGANNGAWTAMVLKRAKVFVHAFEPISATADEFENNVKASTACLNRIALGSKDEEKRIWEARPKRIDQVDASHVSSFWQGNLIGHDVSAHPWTVPCRTVDSYCAEMGIELIDFMKIDVEGAEAEVLTGAFKTMFKNIGIIQFEYNYTWRPAGHSLHQIFHVFRSYGFNIHRIAPGRLLRIDAWRPELERFQFCNYLALRA